MAKQPPTKQLMEDLDRLVAAVLYGRDSAVPKASRRLAPLARIAAGLHGLPREEFRASLKAELERSTTMATPAVAAIPQGYRTVTPYLTVREAPQLLEFLGQAFGAQVLFKGTGSAGGMHAEVKIGDSKVMVGGGGAYPGPWFPTSIHLKVDDVDTAYARALQVGATSI